jgi:hypothetical protein
MKELIGFNQKRQSKILSFQSKSYDVNKLFTLCDKHMKRSYKKWGKERLM